MRSLTHRLVLRLVIVLMVAIILGAAAIGWRALVAVHSLDDRPLQSEARVVASGLHTGPGGELRVDLPPALAVLFSARNNASAYLVTDAAGKPVTGSNPFIGAAVADLLPRTSGLFRLPPIPGHRSGLIGYAARAGRWRIFVMQGREQLEALAHALLRDFLTTGVVLLMVIGAVAIVIAGWTVRQGLAPARAASAAALAIGPSRLGLRLPEEQQPAEIAPLVRAVNEAVARLEHALAAQRRFVGDAAHTLRTPLAVLMARLDALPESAEKAGLRQDADRMARLVGQMLQMARVEGAPLDLSGEIDVRDMAREVIAMLGALAVRRGIELALTGGDGPSQVRGNGAAVVVALENLIDNALRYAPAGSTVEVAMAGPGQVSVLDRGPGLAPGECELIFRRFQRGRQKTASEGAGLGLAIVAEIAAAHGGSVRAGIREGGGAVFTLDLGGEGPALADSKQGHPYRSHEQAQVVRRALGRNAERDESLQGGSAENGAGDAEETKGDWGSGRTGANAVWRLGT
jgi:signal transduction histidine kinase